MTNETPEYEGMLLPELIYAVRREMKNAGVRSDRHAWTADGGAIFYFFQPSKSMQKYASLECYVTGDLVLLLSDRTTEPYVECVEVMPAAIRSALEKIVAFLAETP